jgi:hypothetical protein
MQTGRAKNRQTRLLPTDFWTDQSAIHVQRECEKRRHTLNVALFVLLIGRVNRQHFRKRKQRQVQGIRQTCSAGWHATISDRTVAEARAKRPRTYRRTCPPHRRSAAALCVWLPAAEWTWTSQTRRTTFHGGRELVARRLASHEQKVRNPGARRRQNQGWSWAAVLDGQLATVCVPISKSTGAAQNDAQRRRCDVSRNKTRTDWGQCRHHGGPDPRNDTPGRQEDKCAQMDGPRSGRDRHQAPTRHKGRDTNTNWTQIAALHKTKDDVAIGGIPLHTQLCFMWISVNLAAATRDRGERGLNPCSVARVAAASPPRQFYGTPVCVVAL